MDEKKEKLVYTALISYRALVYTASFNRHRVDQSLRLRPQQEGVRLGVA